MDAVTRRGLRLLMVTGALLLAVSAAVYFYQSSTATPVLDEKNARAVEPFTLTERSGREFSSQELQGQIWVVDFFYTECPGICVNLSQQMARLQQLAARYPEVRLVSVSVDPERDTPPVLSEYAARYGADPQRWLFLTGEKKAIEQVVVRNFLLAMTENPDPNAPPQDRITHSSRLVLIDAQGRIRHYYDALAPDAAESVLGGIEALRREMGRR
jgi:protein SCO1/2